jgi:hypothetical protein
MGELGCDSDLAEEPLGRDTRCGPAPQHLQGDTPVMPQVLGSCSVDFRTSSSPTISKTMIEPQSASRHEDNHWVAVDG